MLEGANRRGWIILLFRCNIIQRPRLKNLDTIVDISSMISLFKKMLFKCSGAKLMLFLDNDAV